jgi:hypothetical protein
MPLPTISLSTSLKPPAALSRGSSNTWNSSPRTQKAGQCRRNSAARVTARSSSRPAARFTATTASGSLSFTSFVERGSCAPVLFANATAELDPINLNFPIVVKEATARSSALGGCYRDDPPSFERNTVRAFLAGSGREKLGFPWHGRQPVPTAVYVGNIRASRSRSSRPSTCPPQREGSQIDEGSGGLRSAACPFDSDLQPWSSKSVAWQTSSTKEGKKLFERKGVKW